MFNQLSQSPFWRTLLSALAGFFGYGAWAYVANMSHGSDMAWRAFFTQGGYSFVITIVLTSLMEQLFTRLRFNPAAKRYWFSTLPICLTLYLTSWGVNFAAGTPNILLTIVPGAVMSTIYVFGYVSTLKLLEKKQEAST
ncbi:MAG: hypothetical protein AB8B86_07160 [Pseudomonadales bacterium]